MRLVEKYRPQSWDEVIGQESIVKAIRELLKKGFSSCPHFLFTGKPGTGKTTISYLIAKELFGSEWRGRIYEFNASDERGIDDIREKVKILAFTSEPKIVLLDEADAITYDAQHALRRIMEQTKSTIFILTANNGWKIIDAIKSRCVEMNFSALTDEQILGKLLEICQKEGIQVKNENREVFMRILELSDGDLRYAINCLSQMVEDGHIAPQFLAKIERPRTVGEMLKLALGGNFENAKRMMEEAVAKWGWEELVKEIYNELPSIEDKDIRLRLYVYLSEIETRCRRGGDPILHLVAFLAFVWLCPHLER